MDTGYVNHLNDSLNKPGTVAFRDQFWALLTAYNVDMYICGHTHATSFNQPITAAGYPYQLDIGHTRGPAQAGPPSTFVHIGVTGFDVTCDFFRVSADNYLLAHTYTINTSS